MQKTIQLSLLSVALLSQLNAIETITLSPIAITSTAIQTDELKSTDAVEVYTQEDIEKAHVQNIYEFLNQQTSITTMSTYGNPFAQKMDFHGYGIGDGYQNIVVTINGRRMNNIDMVPQLLSSIAPSSIKKIEIIKSSGIVTAGDGANAGVINITTKQGNDKEISFSTGTYGMVGGSFYIGHTSKKLSVSATGEAQQSDGIRVINSNQNKDENSFGTGTFNLAYNPNQKFELRLGASASRASVIYAGKLTSEQYNDDPSQQGSSSGKLQKYDTNALNVGVSHYINDNLSLNIDGTSERKKSHYDNLGSAYVSTSNYTYNSFKSTLDYEMKSLSLVAGVDGFYGKRNAGSTIYGAGNKTDKNNIAVFLMSSYKFGNNSIKAGYRYEKVVYKYADSTKSLQDTHVLNGAELGYNYMLDKKSSLFVNYAHSYQAPDIDRFFNYGGTFNSFINPMSANNYTLGYNSITSNNKFKISTYYVDLSNEIYYYSAPWPNSKNTNIDKSHKYGLDLYDNYILNQEFNIVINYNYVQAIIDQEQENGDDYTGKKLPGVSDHNAKATINYSPNQHSTIALSHAYRSEAYAANDFNNNFSQKQDPYNSTDLSATYAKENWEVFAKINNLFNQKNGLWIKDDNIYPVNFTTTALVGFKLRY